MAADRFCDFSMYMGGVGKFSGTSLNKQCRFCRHQFLPQRTRHLKSSPYCSVPNSYSDKVVINHSTHLLCCWWSKTFHPHMNTLYVKGCGYLLIAGWVFLCQIDHRSYPTVSQELEAIVSRPCHSSKFAFNKPREFPWF